MRGSSELCPHPVSPLLRDRNVLEMVYVTEVVWEEIKLVDQTPRRRAREPRASLYEVARRTRVEGVFTAKHSFPWRRPRATVMLRC